MPFAENIGFMTQALMPELNRQPQKLSHIHLMGVCGTGMASLAGMLKTQGYEVSGSDANVYPPMSLLLESLKIPVFDGYVPDNLAQQPDLVIVGNVITRDNPEAIELARLKLPYLSFPQAIRQFAIQEKMAIVVSGTHGKTTTASLVAWILEEAGMDPGFMIGGIPRNFESNFKLGTGAYFVIEGDEYDSAFFDKGPKFLHYNPSFVILTSIEFDHADIYRNLEHVIESFRKLIHLIPKDGYLIANGDDKIIYREIKGALCKLETYGFDKGNGWRIGEVSDSEDLTAFSVIRNGQEANNKTFKTPLFGRHNVSNCLSAVVLAHVLGVPENALSTALRSFRGVKRRQEIIGEKRGITVMDDFAHHPTAVRETVRAVKKKYPHRRLVVVFEPRSNSSRRNIFQAQYAESFDAGDLMMIREPAMVEKIPVHERFSARELVNQLTRKGLEAYSFGETDGLLAELLSSAKQDDVVLIMSNGGFDNLHQRFLEAL
ncbi:MAG: UDP-N-acetylmuramate:L-alanyl-gamma-D-glutamyl-meso-diaminopimelate ligase [Deltaproteobacteria bacterium]|nr:UDP-N-acetylmuramate:L-alanyl-gamma-D-glutamyl-meso-diaminopimelate ligase [Deltaproteobacteria bacterium]